MSKPHTFHRWFAKQMPGTYKGRKRFILQHIEPLIGKSFKCNALNDYVVVTGKYKKEAVTYGTLSKENTLLASYLQNFLYNAKIVKHFTQTYIQANKQNFSRTFNERKPKEYYILHSYHYMYGEAKIVVLVKCR